MPRCNADDPRVAHAVLPLPTHRTALYLTAPRCTADDPEWRTLYVGFQGAAALELPVLRRMLEHDFGEWGPLQNVFIVLGKGAAFVRCVRLLRLLLLRLLRLTAAAAAGLADS